MIIAKAMGNFRALDSEAAGKLCPDSPIGASEQEHRAVLEATHFPHPLYGLSIVVSKPGNFVPRPVARLKWRDQHIFVEPRVGHFQPSDLQLVKASLIAKEPRLGYDAREGPVVLVIKADDKPNEHSVIASVWILGAYPVRLAVRRPFSPYQDCDP